jgi:indolepyruvate ferredoxin oxidoreductase alpha subunit
MRSYDRLLVVEEVDPYLESKLKALAQENKLSVEIVGKSEGFLPQIGELGVGNVREAVARTLGIEYSSQEPSAGSSVRLPTRPPPMCPGCPHIGSYLGLIRGISRAGLKKGEVPVFGDIGCYALALNPPFEAIWTEHSMGASISMASGLEASGFAKPVVAVIGDSTFFHSGIQPLIEAVNKRLNVLVMILDNQTVAMTGHQTTPANEASESGRALKPISLRDVVRGLGVEKLSVVDAYKPTEVADAVKDALLSDGAKVIIVERACAIVAKRRGESSLYRVIPDLCNGCDACTNLLGCPALTFEGDKVSIIEEECLGCGICAGVCPYRAIVEVKDE